MIFFYLNPSHLLQIFDDPILLLVQPHDEQSLFFSKLLYKFSDSSKLYFGTNLVFLKARRATYIRAEEGTRVALAVDAKVGDLKMRAASEEGMVDLKFLLHHLKLFIAHEIFLHCP